MSKKRIAVLVSGSGTNLQAIINQIDRGRIDAEITLVISDKVNAYGLVRAKNQNIPTYLLHEDVLKDDYNQKLLDKLQSEKIDLVVLAGYLKILPAKIIEHYRNRIINIHPSLIPSFCGKGYYGLKVHEAAIEYGVKVSGATVHFVDEIADHGPIILQKSLEVTNEDDPQSLQKKVLEIEYEILPETIRLFCEDRIQVEGRRVIIKQEE